ncbi:hypothetical protein LGH82_33170 [Mesorhizobium sp. PAMC28654]|uniref:hypothetical protein n=1 Tax=Mesorhizobium sp. PAMC28654 TaxID=2880934 RepID=UPI001D0B632D|nr:hypothetical protein [Mesorhizobium sp. PAMC28654]UDL89833.1 hypothetical protein LGH82_33170 [Mesorhizobium sp. PAMC28654]
MANQFILIFALVVFAAVIVAIIYEFYLNHDAIARYESLLAGYEDEFDIHMAALAIKVEPVIRAAQPIAVAVEQNAGSVADAAVAAVSDHLAPVSAVSGQAFPPATVQADVAGAQPAPAPVQ